MTRIPDAAGMCVYPDTTGDGRYRPLPRHTTPTTGPAEGYGLPPALPEPQTGSQAAGRPPATVAVDRGDPDWLHITRWRWWTRPTQEAR